jgi:hypothetical protein
MDARARGTGAVSTVNSFLKEHDIAGSALNGNR